MMKDTITKVAADEAAAYPETDSDVADDVRDALKNLGIADQMFVGVTVDKGVVQLKGFIESYAQKWIVKNAVTRVVGVRAVHNYLEVRVAAPGAPSDGDIAAAAQCALDWNARVPDGVRADVTDGVVRLHGRVESFAQREAAEEAVRNLVGVRDLTNEIRISRDSSADPGSDVESSIRRRFGVLCRSVWVIERDGVVTASGIVPTLELLEEIEGVIHSVPGVVRVENQLIVG